MVDLNLFNSDTSSTIDQFGGPSGKTKFAYEALSLANGLIFYSTASADRLLSTIDVLFPEFNLRSAKHGRSGCITSTITDNAPQLNGLTIYCLLYDGPQGSALACLTDNALPQFINRFQLPPQGTKDRMGIVVREATLVSSHTQTGAAAAIGMGTVVAPWYVPGFEGTHEPDADGSSDGYITGIISADLLHALASWQQSGFCVYQKSYTDADGKNTTLLVVGLVEHETPGPKLVFSLGRMTEQELSLLFDGIERFGPCRKRLVSGDGALICDLDPHATADQVEAQAHELLDTLDRWLHRNDASPSVADHAPADHNPADHNPPQTASVSSQRIHDALKVRLDVTLGRTPADTPSSPTPVRPDAPSIPLPSASAPAIAEPSSTPSIAHTSPKFCMACGAQLSPDAKFCGYCGTRVG